jgi:acetyltransferase-like isoleucine patch superfamily enzyme
MNLLSKINISILKVFNQIRLKYLKLLIGKNFKIGQDFILKGNTRINIWGENGKILIGDSFSIGHNSELYTWNDELHIGASTSVNDNCKIYGNINIGSSCLLASNIFISSGQHNFNYSPTLPIKVQDKLISNDRPVTIEDDCWIGFGVVILPGVYIGKGAIIGSNSVVTKDVFPYTVNAGVPCREISKRFDFAYSYQEIDSKNPNHWPFFYSGCDYKQFNELRSLEKGVQLIEDTSVFLLSKMPGNRIGLSGCCENRTKFRIFLGTELFINVQMESGPFDLKLDLLNEQHEYPLKLDRISDIIKDKFNIILIEVEVSRNINTRKRCKWEITSIGML